MIAEMAAVPVLSQFTVVLVRWLDRTVPPDVQHQIPEDLSLLRGKLVHSLLDFTWN